jgi:outer membrane protein assembly factor BamB
MLWRLKTDEYYRPDGNVVDIIAEDIDGNGTKTILAATRGWKLYAVNPDGKVRWECFIFYHALTKVRVLRHKEKTFIVVGTVYETPINVVDPKSGVVIWKTWEQMGSESMSTTDYCDKHVRDMVFVDADGDGAKDIVFGTEYSSVYTLNAADGKTRWKTLVGDKVSVLRNYGTGQAERILVGTEAGELYVLDQAGKRLKTTSLGSGITGMEVLEYPARERKDILLAAEDGRVAVYDDNFVPRASQDTGKGPVRRILPAGKSGEKLLFYAVGDKSISLVEYHPYFLRFSRDY